MKIEWRLDTEEPIDPENLVGDITVSDTQKRLEERDTYIDSWLDAFITGLKAVQAGRRAQIDIPEEPAPLVLEPVGKRMQISYRTMRIDVESIEELQSALCLAAQEFLRQLADVEGWEHHQILRNIRDFVSNASRRPAVMHAS